MGNGFDIHAAFGGHNKGNKAGFAINEDRQVKLPVNLGTVLYIEPVDLLAAFACLERDQRVAEHFLYIGEGFVTGK